MVGFCLAVASLHIGQDAFERIAAGNGIATVINIVEIDNVFTAASEDEVLVLLGQ